MNLARNAWYFYYTNNILIPFLIWQIKSLNYYEIILWILFWYLLKYYEIYSHTHKF